MTKTTPSVMFSRRLACRVFRDLRLGVREEGWAYSVVASVDGFSWELSNVKFSQFFELHSKLAAHGYESSFFPEGHLFALEAKLDAWCVDLAKYLREAPRSPATDLLFAELWIFLRLADVRGRLPAGKKPTPPTPEASTAVEPAVGFYSEEDRQVDEKREAVRNRLEELRATRTPRSTTTTTSRKSLSLRDALTRVDRRHTIEIPPCRFDEAKDDLASCHREAAAEKDKDKDDDLDDDVPVEEFLRDAAALRSRRLIERKKKHSWEEEDNFSEDGSVPEDDDFRRQIKATESLEEDRTTTT